MKRTDGSNDLPAEYLNSSLAQQSQTPARKTDQELKEEEELQLALALSQSEAEQKSKKVLHQFIINIFLLLNDGLFVIKNSHLHRPIDCHIVNRTAQII